MSIRDIFEDLLNEEKYDDAIIFVDENLANGLHDKDTKMLLRSYITLLNIMNIDLLNICSQCVKLIDIKYKSYNKFPYVLCCSLDKNKEFEVSLVNENIKELWYYVNALVNYLTNGNVIGYIKHKKGKVYKNKNLLSLYKFSLTFKHLEVYENKPIKQIEEIINKLKTELIELTRAQ